MSSPTDSTVRGLQSPVTASLGTAELLDSNVELASLLRRAATALYLAKEQGRNQVQGIGSVRTVSRRERSRLIPTVDGV